MAAYLEVQSASSSHGKSVLGKEGSTSCHTNGERYLTRVRASKENLGEGGDPIEFPVGKAWTSEVGEDISTGGYYATSRGAAGAEPGNAKATKVCNEAQPIVQVVSGRRAAAMRPGDPVSSADRRSPPKRVAPKQLDPGRIAAPLSYS